MLHIDIQIFRIKLIDYPIILLSFEYSIYLKRVSYCFLIGSFIVSDFCITEYIFATLPRTQRGQPLVLGGDPKGKNFLYTNGNSVIIRNIDVSF